jgi:hypothetical protein
MESGLARHSPSLSVMAGLFLLDEQRSLHEVPAPHTPVKKFLHGQQNILTIIARFVKK